MRLVHDDVADFAPALHPFERVLEKEERGDVFIREPAFGEVRQRLLADGGESLRRARLAAQLEKQLAVPEERRVTLNGVQSCPAGHAVVNRCKHLLRSGPGLPADLRLGAVLGTHPELRFELLPERLHLRFEQVRDAISQLLKPPGDGQVRVGVEVPAQLLSRGDELPVVDDIGEGEVVKGSPL